MLPKSKFVTQRVMLYRRTNVNLERHGCESERVEAFRVWERRGRNVPLVCL